ncbi:hypothetical protein Q1695_002380 [Nippostrongylus brasiliensis]|nr:hypothetical protein Q1695_002380 [Nippostrongylus brasiliensis]
MSFAIAFFPHSSTADVVPATAVLGEVKRGVTTKVKWCGRSYTAKLLFIGPKVLCETKISKVSRSGELLEEEFDMDCNSTNIGTTECVTPASDLLRSEILEKLQELEGKILSSGDFLADLIRECIKDGSRDERQDRVNAELLRRIPAPHGEKGSLVYTYATAETVSALRSAHKDSMKFVRMLETEVFKDEPSELVHKVDDRKSIDRMNFLQECLYKYFNVPLGLRAEVWGRAKASLNSKARRLRKSLRDIEQQRANSNEDTSETSRSGINDDPFEWDE